MCPLSFPICIPYWIWVLLLLFGITSWHAVLISAAITVGLLSIGFYRLYRQGRLKSWFINSGKRISKLWNKIFKRSK